MSNRTPPALLLVDIQQGFEDVEYWGGLRNNPNAEHKAGEILAYWRQKGWPVIHVKHNSTNPNSPLVAGKPGNAIHSAVQPQGDEPVLEKTVNSAFIGTDLEERLHRAGIRRVVIVGMTTNHCISTTVRMSGNLGFETYLVKDAAATFDTIGVDGTKFSAKVIHDTTLANLDKEFCQVIDSTQIDQLF
ncbi:MAG: cysteine hydrolase family protein [Bacteroidota bacterium]